MAKYGYLIQEISIGVASTDGAMPTSLVPIADTVEGSVSIDEKELTTKEFKVDQSDNPVKIVVTDAGGIEISFAVYDISPSTLKTLKGGTATTETKWEPTTGASVILENSVRIKTTSGVTFDIPKAALSTVFGGGLKKDDMLTLKSKVKPLLVVSTKPVYSVTFA